MEFVLAPVDAQRLCADGPVHVGLQDQPSHAFCWGFVYAHRVHKQPHIATVWSASLEREVGKDVNFGVLSFVYQNRVNAPVMTYRNKWPEDWYMH